MSAKLKVTIKVSPHAIIEQKTDSIAFLVEQGFDSASFNAVATAFFPALSAAMTKQKFTGKALSSLVVPGSQNGAMRDLIFVGLGKRKDKKNIDAETYRRALGVVTRLVEARKGTSLAVQLPDPAVFGIDMRELAKQTTIALQMALYHFDEFITDEDRKIKDLKEVDFVTDGDKKAVQAGIEEGNIIALSVNTCRYWIDLPPENLTPTDMTHKAKEIAKDNGLKITVFNEHEVCTMGMGGLAQFQKDRIVIAIWLLWNIPAKKARQPLAFVGKGITFDSGGLSIKPAASMETMKEDMSGAAAVIAAMVALAKLKPDVNIVAAYAAYLKIYQVVRQQNRAILPPFIMAKLQKLKILMRKGA